MTSGKNLYKTAIISAIFGALFMLAIPKTHVSAYMLTPQNPSTSSNYYNGGASGCYYNGCYGGNNNGNNTGNNNNNNYGNNNANNFVVTYNTAFVSTEPAFDINKTSAVVQGTTFVDGGNATVWFEWGKNVSKFENTTPTIVVGQSSSGASFQLTNLSAGTKYFYRIIARTGAGNSYGIVRSFTTTGSAVIVNTNSTNNTSTNTNNNSNNTNSSNNTSGSQSTSSNSNGNIKGSLSATAANANNSNSFMPTSVIGWMIIIILVLAIVLAVRKIQIDNEAKKKREEEAKKLAEAFKTV